MNAVSKSVSLPKYLWEAVAEHAPTTVHKDRSGYIRSLVEADLQREGKLPSLAASDAVLKAELLAAAEQMGLPAAIEQLRRRIRSTSTSASKAA